MQVIYSVVQSLPLQRHVEARSYVFCRRQAILSASLFGLFLVAGLHCAAQAVWVTDEAKHTITEYSYSGYPQRTITVPYPGTNPYSTLGTEYPRNVTQAPDGSLWVFNGTFSPYISNVPTSGSPWTNYANQLFEIANNLSYGGIAVSGTTVFVTNDLLGGFPSSFAILAYDVDTGTPTQMGAAGSTALNIGQDGMLYAVDDSYTSTTTVSVYNPTTLALVKHVTLSGSTERDLRGVTALASGHIIIATWDGHVQEYDANGSFLRQIQLGQSPPTDAELMNVSIGADGSYLAGSRFGWVYMVNPELTAYTTFNPNPAINEQDITFANPVLAPIGPLVEAAAPLQSATYGQTFYLAVPPGTFSDPDPSPTVTYSAADLPPGLSFDPESLTISGTPTLAGSYSLTVTATDGGGRTASATVSFNVAKAAATILLGELTQTYDGTPEGVTVTTVPAGLATTVTYNYSSQIPVGPGSFTVWVTISDPNYQGSATGTLQIDAMPSPTPSPTPTPTPTPSPTPTHTPTPPPSPTPTRVPTPTPRPSPTPEQSPTPVPTPTAGISPTPSPTPTPTPTRVPTPTPRPSPTPKPSPTPGITPAPSVTPSPTPTRAPTPTPRPSPTPKPSPTPSPTLT